jgi:hypothetical protein
MDGPQLIEQVANLLVFDDKYDGLKPSRFQSTPKPILRGII